MRGYRRYRWHFLGGAFLVVSAAGVAARWYEAVRR